MPTLRRFKIKNFRGIQSAEINVDVRKKSNVITLIGLNESGKTTILEALSYFSTGDRSIPNLVAKPDSGDHLISLIPIYKRAAFTDSVSITAEIGMTFAQMKDYYSQIEQELSVNIVSTNKIGYITASKRFNFVDSIYTGVANIWGGVDFDYKLKKDKKFKTFSTVGKDATADAIFRSFVAKVQADFYDLVYFPTFIVDFPQRIYLEEHEDESPINVYYRKVIEYIIKSVDQDLDLKKHIIDRLKEAQRVDGSPFWFSRFFGRSERKLIDSVLDKIQSAINKEVIGNWEKVFSSRTGSRSIKIEWGVDDQKKDMAYLSFAISDGSSTYSIHERSLGFRWFFSYLLFTQFRSRAGKNTIFLFDEPAANLHAKAQMQLISSIDRLINAGNKVIYSTHSPHMINPSWLSDAFIIENFAINVEDEEDIYGFNAKPNDIRAMGYGEFVGLYPEKKTYFQPVWEKLLYETPPMIGAGPYLCFEGISDFHFLSYVAKETGRDYKFSLVPGVGAGGFGATLPSLYGSGARFILLLDDDAQGVAEKNRYIKSGILAEGQVYTLSDVSSDFSGKKLETIVSKAGLEIIKSRFGGKSGKKQIALYLAEIAASGKDNALDAETISKGKMILDWMEEKAV